MSPEPLELITPDNLLYSEKNKTALASEKNSPTLEVQGDLVMGLVHDNENGKPCASHAMFETLIKQSLDNMSEKLSDGVDALRNQNAATAKALEENSKALTQVLENQADRREMCGRQVTRIDKLEKSDDVQWICINTLNKKMHMAVGALIVAQLIVPPVVWFMFKSMIKVPFEP